MTERAEDTTNRRDGEVVYDAAGDASVTVSAQSQAANNAPPASEDGCHGGATEMRQAAKAAGKSTLLERYSKD